MANKPSPAYAEALKKVTEAMASGRQLSAGQIAEETGISVKRVGAVLGNLKNQGAVHYVGETTISKYRVANVYCIHAAKREAVVIPKTKQTWLAALGGV